MSEAAQNLRPFPLLARALAGICLLVIAERMRLAIVLYGWENEWPVAAVWAASFVPMAAVIAVFGYLIWRRRR